MTGASPATRLGDEVGKLKEFLDLLHREQSLLAAADTQALVSLVEGKNALAAELAVCTHSRENALQKAGLPPTRAGMEAWLTRAGNENQRHDWRLLLDLATSARDLNETNGKLIALHLDKNQQAFATLVTAANRATLYGPNGQQHGGGFSRILGTA